ncbi:MAG: TVP38/TMEM64 family protein [Clostridia bacterium]|nr:TVP38/TMEM64 family protein [Clostridia bacterium]
MDDKKRRRIVSLVSFITLLGVMILITVLFGETLIDMVKDPEVFRERTDGMGLLGKLLFVALVALQVVLAVLPGQVFCLAGGYCFGPFWGILLTVAGTALGSLIAFLLARFLGLRVVTAFYPEEKLQKLSFLRESKQQDLFTFIVFLIPGIPKDMVTYFMGLTQMRLHKFLLISTMGRLPALALTVLGGTALQTRNLTLIIVVICLVLLLLVAGYFFYRRKKSNS